MNVKGIARIRHVDCCKWLTGVLNDVEGELTSTELRVRAESHGFSMDDVRGARDAVGARTVKRGFGNAGYWVYEWMPTDEHGERVGVVKGDHCPCCGHAL